MNRREYLDFGFFTKNNLAHVMTVKWSDQHRQFCSLEQKSLQFVNTTTISLFVSSVAELLALRVLRRFSVAGDLSVDEI